MAFHEKNKVVAQKLRKGKDITCISNTNLIMIWLEEEIVLDII